MSTSLPDPTLDEPAADVAGDPTDPPPGRAPEHDPSRPVGDQPSRTPAQGQAPWPHPARRRYRRCPPGRHGHGGRQHQHPRQWARPHPTDHPQPRPSRPPGY
jgi:hypothetical protein